MEVLSPSPPVLAAPELLSFLPSPSAMAFRLQTLTSKLSPQSSGSSSGGDPMAVHVAVGRSLEKGKVLILWALRCFGCKEVVLVHVLKPSPTIPTLLGNIPAKRASEEVVSAHRMGERKQARRILQHYVSCCHQAKVKASFLIAENEDVEGGLLHLANTHTIRRLVMGTTLSNCLKINKGLEKASILAKNAPSFCEIWFVKNGKHIWTKDAADTYPDSGGIVFEPMSSSGNDLSSNLEANHSVSPPAELSEGANRIQSEFHQQEALINVSSDFLTMDEVGHASDVSTSPMNRPSFIINASAGGRLPQMNPKDEEENYSSQGLPTEESSCDPDLLEDAFEESINYTEWEREITEAVNRAKLSKAAIRCERKITKELKQILKGIRRQMKQVTEQRNVASVELAKTLEALPVLESDAQRAGQHRDEVAEDLKVIQDSIVTLKIERYKIRQLREEAKKHDPHAEPENCKEFVGFPGEGFIEFSSSDLQNATCHFSESFKIGQGSYGSVYKGELLNKSVAIKKFYPQNIQALMEFEQEVRELGNLRHPHLVALIGICSEARSLVLDYMPNGNLLDRLFRKTNSTLHWTWQERTRTASEIASALLLLHSLEPNQIIHGDLKPENILFDSDWRCKVGDFGIGRVMLEGSLRCPSFGRSSDSTGLFSYTDPEYERAGKLTPKSDVFSFGIIILQLLTGRRPAGLVSDVRRAMLAGKISSIIDRSAGQWPLSVATRLAELGLQCCENNSRDRPELTVLFVRELQRMHILEEQPAPHFFLCPILQEIMHDPHLAADGYTYEGKALRNWFESGHDTSPMTNLKLDDLSLTPNHTLRLAIQEWLCQPCPPSMEDSMHK